MSSIFGKSKAPPAPEPVRMPDPEDREAQDARRRAEADYSANRGGRASTVLSGSYSGTRLGSTGGR